MNAKNGNIYSITIDIAKTSDGRLILYATKGKIRKVGQTKVNSLKVKGSRSHSNFIDIISNPNENVKSKNSVDDTIIDFNDDWFFDEDLFFEDAEEHINFEKVIKDSPADALNIIYNTASKTALSLI